MLLWNLKDINNLNEKPNLTKVRANSDRGRKQFADITICEFHESYLNTPPQLLNRNYILVAKI